MRLQDVALLAGRQSLHADPQRERQGHQSARLCPLGFAGLHLIDRARRYTDSLREFGLFQLQPFP